MSRRSSLLYVLLFSSFFSFSQEDAYTLEDGLNKKFYLKVYPLYCLMNRYSAGLEYFYKKNLSVELQPVLLFKNQNFHESIQPSISNIIFAREGIEVFAGINFLSTKLRYSQGIYFSYKYAHIDNNIYWYYPDPGSYNNRYYYRFSQTRNQIGVYYRASFIKNVRRFSFEFYAMAGVRVGESKTTVFYYSNLAGYISYPMTQMNMSGLYNCNGAYAYPEVKFGFYPCIKLN